MKSTKVSPKPVSPKDTKQTILEAYQDLVGQLTEEEMSPALTQKLESTNSDLKVALTKVVADLTTKFDEANNVLTQLHALYEKKRRAFEEGEETSKKLRSREEEEYKYEFEKLKARQEEELKEYKGKVLVEIEERKAVIKHEEDEIAELRVRARGFDQELEKAVKEAVDKNTKELTEKFAHEKALMEQEAKAKENLLTQKIESLDATIKQQSSQITQLQESLRKASEQLTRIAERAVEKGTSTITSTTPKL